MRIPCGTVTAVNTLILGKKMRSHSRIDHLTAQRVEVGLVFYEMLGEADALAYLRGEHIPAEVIERVLKYPQHRRKYDGWASMQAPPPDRERTETPCTQVHSD